MTKLYLSIYSLDVYLVYTFPYSFLIYYYSSTTTHLIYLIQLRNFYPTMSEFSFSNVEPSLQAVLKRAQALCIPTIPTSPIATSSLTTTLAKHSSSSSLPKPTNQLTTISLRPVSIFLYINIILNILLISNKS